METDYFKTDSMLIAAIKEQEKKRPNYRRDRGLLEYSYLIDLDLPSISRKFIREKGFFKWYDMCCGDFNIGRDFVHSYSSLFLNKLEIRGIDIDIKTPEDQISYDGALIISKGNVISYPIPPDVDLITCVNGLYLIDEVLGFNKVCEAIEHWYNSLSVGGLLLTMRERPLIGHGTSSFNIAKYLKSQLGDSVEDHESSLLEPMDRHDYIRITKLSPNHLSVPRSFGSSV
ncbi:MAG: hypothetical protein M1268_00145 [Patescibacteria group bacterium]|nr:hypothetical protein [Patescibacteria group bacterium]